MPFVCKNLWLYIRIGQRHIICRWWLWIEAGKKWVEIFSSRRGCWEEAEIVPGSKIGAEASEIFLSTYSVAEKRIAWLTVTVSQWQVDSTVHDSTVHVTLNVTWPDCHHTLWLKEASLFLQLQHINKHHCISFPIRKPNNDTNIRQMWTHPPDLCYRVSLYLLSDVTVMTYGCVT